MTDARADSAQRNEALGVLTAALDAGRLDLIEYDARVVAIGSAGYVSELVAQAGEFGWAPHPFPPPVTPARPPSAYGKIALVLGLISVPLSLCLVGWIFGVLAIVYSGRAGVRGFGAALVGRVSGILGVVLSLGAGLSLGYAMTHSVGP